MKKIILGFIFALSCGVCFAQQVVVAVFPFEARSGTSPDDANTVTEVFNIKLQATGALRTVGRNVIDNVIKQEHIYQMSDFASDEKTAQLRKGLNADWVVYGVVTKLGRTFVITATLIDLNTNETMGGAPMQMDSIEEAFEKMDAPITEMIQRLTGGSGRVAAAPAGPNKEAVSHLERGITFFDRNDLDMALAEFNEAIRIDQNYGKAYAWRGRVYVNKGDNDRGIADCNQAIRIDPNDGDAYYNRGNAYSKKGDYDRAIADFTQAIGIYPDYASAYYWRASAYRDRDKGEGDYTKAIADYTQAIRIVPNHPLAYIMRAFIYELMGDYAKAIADYTQELRNYSDNADVYEYRGTAYENKGDYEKAIEDYTQALRIDPNHARAKQGLENAQKRRR